MDPSQPEPQSQSPRSPQEGKTRTKKTPPPSPQMLRPPSYTDHEWNSQLRIMKWANKRFALIPTAVFTSFTYIIPTSPPAKGAKTPKKNIPSSESPQLNPNELSYSDLPVELTTYTTEMPEMSDFKSLVLSRTPLLDVRASIEFKLGAFETSTNISLMTDQERHDIGICFKTHGHGAAVELGHKLVSVEARKPRIEEWVKFLNENPGAFVYCFRGGQRSKISQQWLFDHGHKVTRLKGGYKAFRRFLIDYLSSIPSVLKSHNIHPIVLAGRTGSGKTLVLHQLTNALDLEGIANHRGSAFGRHFKPQPTQINFENNLSMELMRFVDRGERNIVVEDEARNIGAVNLEIGLFEALKNGPRVVMETTVEERVDITHKEYIHEAQAEYGDLDKWVEFMMDAFTKIQKRLGGDKHKVVVNLFEKAMEMQKRTGDAEGHREWIEVLLIKYYDPMYDYVMAKSRFPVIFKGKIDEVVKFLREYNGGDDDL